MNPDLFQYHDLSQFPLVLTRHFGAPAGYAQIWIKEMEQLVSSPEPFVLVTQDLGTPISHDDRKKMVQWQTENMPRIRQASRGYIAVKPDISGYERACKQAEKMTRAFDFPFVVVNSMVEARAAARRLMAGLA
ncbi:hypothetical protein [Bordetella holmesii]|uniref:N-acetyltransferase YedL n=2 Tax=Bordetella holmesii TaxID=35814 RepID=A0ABN0S2B3_9BORD|nr:hypothetical protein [Bordetella holmesii]AHV94484.1 hypothetical protein D560_1233 [Bordetella holmesii ATCC 51541]AIT25899.1 hypothetical protein D558_1221 [Bordetella holmesii 44057]EWM41521.1 hypothetical protein D556_1229 [Bordetella holmesii 41130]EWM46468.1 hypothetical protein D555_1243 [Bordetella holmesii 35009]EWM50634.1 hypothetical protein D557_0479 [Bordetella holmesii 70147]